MVRALIYVALVASSIFFLTSCWNARTSPVVKNESTTSLEIRLVFEEKERQYVLMKGSTLRLVGLLDQIDFNRVEIISEEGKKILLTREFFEKHSITPYSLFVVDEGFEITFQDKGEFQ